MTRVGLVGAGPWATMFHAPMLAGASRLELAVVWARRPEAAAVLADRFGIQAVGSFDELLSRCDAVAFGSSRWRRPVVTTAKREPVWE